MTRPLSTALAAHFAGNAHTRAKMLRIDLVDGTTLAFTDHDRVLTFDLGDGAVDYSPATGILPSDLSLSAGFDADDMQVTGPIGDVVTQAAVEGGRFDDATVRFFLVNWADLSMGSAPLLKGFVALGEVQGGKFVLTIHSQVSRMSQSIGRVITGYCDADFGDARCSKVVAPVAATVTGVTDDRSFTVSFSGTYADDHFNKGTVAFTSGALAGIRPVEIFDWAGIGAVALWASLPEPPQVGDTLELRQGCYDPASNSSKTRAACMAFDNIANFRGFPDVPGSDKALQYPNPGSGG